ncbi:hypothetical protein KGA66_11925 [Actinocrinis puniceicyclus]|uniref:Uncharacterized protein n=1 Tax=Actinocrinis puniceicyclus TaxID=977794 RepID=A0A8J7WK57_9ACTN|nr:hypothetical protein [Actinocrinis puniceicyclus]MBS2963761.1 hypothetical protein [Actinocrinis puniceicyclus]
MTESGVGQSMPSKRSRRRVAAIIVWLFSGALVLAAASWLLYYRVTFHTFAWWSVPPSVTYCGRDYLEGRTVDALLPGYTYPQVMTVEPAGWPVYAQLPVGTTRVQAAGLPCTMGLVLKRGGGQYILYGLSGGP